MRVLIFGLSGSGKTTLAKELAYHFLMPHYNADTIRELYNDWDFSEPARYRSAHRMSKSGISQGFILVMSLTKFPD